MARYIADILAEKCAGNPRRLPVSSCGSPDTERETRIGKLSEAVEAVIAGDWERQRAGQ